ncbi:DUF2188 domain-containing protein [Bacillus massiliglaciei]|uniref:DUF2188 domain-containing protein n=1 Tax=Bacillus massiliglaciei TaxID=1816693 RepID=UPI001F37F053|nr:DUF2188 domain-containing protein [Bacillus massiliglaciei]
MSESGEERDQYFKERAGTDEARFHVVPQDDEGWAVKREGEDDPVFSADKKTEAVEEAKKWRKNRRQWPIFMMTMAELKNS